MIQHVNSHKITIFRLGTFLSKAQSNSNANFLSGSKESIGSYWESESSHKVGSGLTLEEEKILLPDIIDVEVTDKDFRKKVTEFYNEITTNVPYEKGVDLEIGLTKDNSQPIAPLKDPTDPSTGNMPISVMDYIRYRHAKGHPWVASSKDTGEGNLGKKFYIFDKDALQNRKTIIDKEKDAAMQTYLKLKNEEDLVDQMLTLMGIDTRIFTTKDKVERKQQKLRELAETESTKFTDTYNLGELEVRAWIGAMVTTGVLKKVGERIIDAETKEEIGNSIDEAIYFFKDEDKSAIVTVLKARLQEASIKVPTQDARKTIVA